MKSSRSVAVLAAAVLLAGLTSCGEGRDEKPRPEPKDTRTIPLKEIYSTSRQKGLQLLRSGEVNPTERALVPLLRGVAGPSNIVLVRGKDITAAVNATRRAFTLGAACEVPVGPDDGSDGKALWLAAFFGTTGSRPPAWLVQSAERTGETVRLSFLKPERDTSTKDIHHYFCWVPLGELPAGTYTLELFDVGKKEVTLLRRVTVLAK